MWQATCTNHPAYDLPVDMLFLSVVSCSFSQYSSLVFSLPFVCFSSSFSYETKVLLLLFLLVLVPPASSCLTSFLVVLYVCSLHLTLSLLLSPFPSLSVSLLSCRAPSLPSPSSVVFIVMLLYSPPSFHHGSQLSPLEAILLPLEPKGSMRHTKEYTTNNG